MMVLLDLADERSLSHLLAVRHGITKTLYPVHRLNAPDDAVDCFTFRITEPRFATQGTRQLDRDASITLLDGDSGTLKHKPRDDTVHHMFYTTPLEDTYCLKVHTCCSIDTKSCGTRGPLTWRQPAETAASPNLCSAPHQ